MIYPEKFWMLTNTFARAKHNRDNIREIVLKLDERRIKKKSVKELLDISLEIIRDYRILFDKILGKTPEEIQETKEALEGFTPADIREAIKLYRSITPDEDIDRRIILGGFTPIEIREAVNLYIMITPDKIQEMNNILAEFTPIEIREALRTYRARHPKNM